ncbi:lectin-like domain-containing protein [Staphylococcus intermedius]|uniref:Serine-rich adhesin for platelets n=2 Tax=Staphylococcus intermedius TaxID=1285 RepID=A0A380G659_STAIN|nr:putative Ig domain-containing protein [Staphylococcus intermedius]PCF64220.1 hypothetical protein B5C04_09620 [Staphylococcus intermedius]PCF78935.1 hypothetical protein B4W74_09970 [Staphylococcus intermedius]PCF79907.1 hypothetical protein B4W70_09610 [Staphylococcus intermedius]SUM45461.1 serine threonine rich antigen [Staphylococcus intermedius NCTC 11048]
MSKKEKALNESLKQEKSRVKLYKSGKHWVRSGIKEFKLLHIMGLPLLTSRSIEEDDECKGNVIKRHVIKVSTLAGGVLTANAFQGHEAMAASELPLTSKLSTQSEAVANQNSTVLSQHSNCESETVSSESVQSSEQNDVTTHTQTSESDSVSLVESQNVRTSARESHSEMAYLKTSESAHAKDSAITSETHSAHTPERQSMKASHSENTIQHSESAESHTSPHAHTTTKAPSHEHHTMDSSESKENDATSFSKTGEKGSSKPQHRTSTTAHDATTQHAQSISQNKARSSVTTSASASSLSQSLHSEVPMKTVTKVFKPTTWVSSESVATPTTTSESHHTKRTRKARSVSHLTTTRDTTSRASDQVIVTRDNFKSNFTPRGTAYYVPETGIVTLTSDARDQRGSITLGSRVDFGKSFELVGAVNLGTRYEGHSPDGVLGGDGIGFVFSPGPLGEVGKKGAAVGFGGLNSAFGFKLDTFHNSTQPKAGDDANADPPTVGGGGAFGAFVTTNKRGVAVTYTEGTTTATAAKLHKQPNGTFEHFLINYDATTKVMTVVYANQKWSKDISEWLLRSGNTTFSFSISASTGDARNLQQIQVGSLYYTEAAVTHVHYFDADTGQEIIAPKKIAGNVGDVVNVDQQRNALSARGYRYVKFYSKDAPTYNASKNTAQLTGAGQTMVFFYKDVTAPRLDMPTQTKELNSPITPITVNTTDNGTGHVKNMVADLPPGLKFDEVDNVITGTPLKLGTYKVTVTSIDDADNFATSTFDFNIIDTTNPIVQVDHQFNEVFDPINEVEIKTMDNSGTTTDTVTGLPPGLTYNPETKRVSGTPMQIGEFTVTVTSQDSSHNTTKKSFVWTIERNVESDSISNSQSTSLSESKSMSTSNSLSTLLSAIKRVSEAESTSVSNSMSMSDSKSESASVSLSNSISDSESTSISDSISVSNSASTSNNLSLSSSESMSGSVSDSDSISLSESISTSMSGSTSVSTSLSKSYSTSTSLSQSERLSTSANASMSVSTSESSSGSTSLSNSISISLSESANNSTSVSNSGSISGSTSASLSQSTSTSFSLSVSDSIAISDSQSTPTSNSVSASASTSTRASVSQSHSLSTSQSTSTSESASVSTSLSSSESVSMASSASVSTSHSDSLSTSTSESLSLSGSMSHSTSTSVSGSLSTSNSTSTSISSAHSTSHSESVSDCLQHHSTSESTSQSMHPTTSEAISQQPSVVPKHYSPQSLPNTGTKDTSKDIFVGLLSALFGLALFGKAKKDKKDKTTRKKNN